MPNFLKIRKKRKMSKKLKTDLPGGKRPLSMQEALDLAKKDKAEQEAREAEARQEHAERRKRLAAERTPLPPPAPAETDSDEIKQPVEPEVFELADDQAPTAIGQPYVFSYKGKPVAHVQIAQRTSGDTIRLRTGGSRPSPRTMRRSSRSAPKSSKPWSVAFP
jgi:hypothetical protein